MSPITVLETYDYIQPKDFAIMLGIAILWFIVVVISFGFAIVYSNFIGLIFVIIMSAITIYYSINTDDTSELRIKAVINDMDTTLKQYDIIEQKGGYYILRPKGGDE